MLAQLLMKSFLWKSQIRKLLDWIGILENITKIRIVRKIIKKKAPKFNNKLTSKIKKIYFNTTN